MEEFRKITDPGVFFSEAYASLGHEASKNCLLLGLASDFQSDQKNCALLAVHGRQEPSPDNIYALISLQQDRSTIVCSPSQDFDALMALVDGCLAEGVKADFGHAEEQTAKLIKVCFEERGFPTQKVVSQGIFQCREPKAPERLEGLHLIKANLENHGEIVEAWGEAFFREAMPGRDPKACRAIARAKVEKEQLYLLHNNEIFLGMAGWSRALPDSVSVNFVYVPPDHRGKGYAKAVTYLVTEQLLSSEGFQETNLFTDLGNETSNALYHKIGYNHIGFSEYFSISST